MKQALLDKYHQGIITDEETLQLEGLIASGEVELEDLETYNALDHVIIQPNQVELPSSLDEQMATLWEDEAGESKVNKSWIKWLFIGVGLIIAFGLGQVAQEGNQSSETPILEQEPPIQFASTLLETERATDRIHLVSNTEITNDTDQKVIDALMYALNNDESTNVRLACIEALFDYSSKPEVRAGFVKAIGNQSSPIVLSNLAEAINASGNTISKEEIKSMLDNKLPDPIKESIEQGFIHI